MTELRRSDRWASVFFTLKDPQDGSCLGVSIARGQFDALRLELADGDRVHAYGRPELFEARGEFRLRALSLERFGLGDHLAALERLKTKLAAEGLFAAERKRPLPLLPARIGLVTGQRRRRQARRPDRGHDPLPAGERARRGDLRPGAARRRRGGRGAARALPRRRRRGRRGARRRQLRGPAALQRRAAGARDRRLPGAGRERGRPRAGHAALRPRRRRPRLHPERRRAGSSCPDLAQLLRAARPLARRPRARHAPEPRARAAPPRRHARAARPRAAPAARAPPRQARAQRRPPARPLAARRPSSAATRSSAPATRSSARGTGRRAGRRASRSSSPRAASARASRRPD